MLGLDFVGYYQIAFEKENAGEKSATQALKLLFLVENWVLKERVEVKSQPDLSFYWECFSLATHF